ncbi:MAG TPA: carboxymuconolactone decarboxylase family protein [Candidatus Thermoplasmatota archaeon]|nr:carboxymuconolactone decarboxylase family protein [Candidatus Thermoplasmatota archaeon]
MDVQEFRSERARLNEMLLGQEHLGVKRFFNLDHAAYGDGALDARTKEWMGLVGSLVLRCNDCVVYHLDQLVTKHAATREELLDGLNVGLVVGGSITIPHLRTAWDAAEQLLKERDAKG